jgi:hypothetical protein
MDENGFIKSAKTFRIGSMIYVARKQKVVLHLSPHITVNTDDEKSCYAVLLLHTVWPDGDEDAILGFPLCTAVERLSFLRSHQLLPIYVESFLERVTRSETIMEVQGQPQTGHEIEEDEPMEDIEDGIPHITIEQNDDDDGEQNFDIDATDGICDDIVAVNDMHVREHVSKRKIIALRNYIKDHNRSSWIIICWQTS